MSSYDNRFAKFITGAIILLLSHMSCANGVAGKLENQKPVSGVITGAGVDSYTFQVSAPSSFMVTVSETGKHVDHFAPHLKLIDPNNKVANQYGGEFHTDLAKEPAWAGQWKVEVSRQDGGKRGGSYKITLLEMPGATGTAMAFGKLYEGSLFRGAVGVYTFKGTAGGKAHLSLAPKGGAGLILAVNVFSPGGDAFAANSCRDNCSVDMDLKDTGTYTAMLWRDDLNDNKGAYTVSLQQGMAAAGPIPYAGNLPGNPLGGMPLQNGQQYGVSPQQGMAAADPIPYAGKATGDPLKSKDGMPLQRDQRYAGSIAGKAIDLYTLDGNGMSMVELALAPQGFSPMVTLFGPDGELLGTASCSGSCSLDIPPLRPGISRIMIWRKDENGPKGSYILSVVPGQTREGRPIGLPPGMPMDPAAASLATEVPPTIDYGPHQIVSGKAVTGVVKGQRVDRYTFTTDAKQSFILTLSEKGRPAKGFIPQVQITGPGNLVAGGSLTGSFIRVQDPAPPTSGKWVVEVSRGDVGEDGGDYSLSMLEFPGAKGKPLQFDKSYSGAIEGGAIDVYTLSGTPGLMALLTLEPEKETGMRPDMMVFAPDGTFATGGGGMGMGTVLTMTEYGDYTVLVSRDDSNNDRGSYSLSVKRTDGTPEPPPVDASAYLRNGATPVFAERMRPMARSAYVYRQGIFLPIGLPKPVTEDGRPPDVAGAPMELYMGDDDGGLSRQAIGWWIKAAADGSTDAVNRLGVVPDAFKRYLDKKYESAAWYRRVVEQGSSDPDFTAAIAQMNGGVEQDFALLKKKLLPVATKGIPAAQLDLGVLYALGHDAPPDFVQAAQWYKKAADQGLIVAENNLAELYEHGQGVPKDYSEAARLYLEAGQAGYPAALYHLGMLAEKGLGMTADVAKAKSWLKEAADGGFADAEAELDALEGREAQALALWRSMADRDDAAALQRLVEIYQKEGVPAQDHDAVLELYRKASSEINPVAFIGLGDMFARQNPPDYFEAYFWYSLVSDPEKGAYLPPDELTDLKAYSSPRAEEMKKHLTPVEVAVTKWRIDDRHPKPPGKELEAAAKIYMRGLAKYNGGDKTSGIILIMRAAHMGLPFAEYDLGGQYERGCTPCGGYLPVDIRKSIESYTQAVIGGHVGSATQIGHFYQFGIGVPQDLGEAAMWYEMDASRGDVEAMNYLGSIYLYEEKDAGQAAIEMYEKASARDLESANDALGMIYLYGMGGVPVNTAKALKWYIKAFNKGDDVGAIQAAAILVHGNPPDYGRAIDLVKKFGSPVAYNDLAYLYEHGFGPKDPAGNGGFPVPTAVELYKKASDACYGQAMYHIGLLYANGANAPEISAQPISKDPKAAVEWMSAAARFGSKPAFSWLRAYSPSLAVQPPTAQQPQENVDFSPEPCPAPKGGQQ